MLAVWWGFRRPCRIPTGAGCVHQRWIWKCELEFHRCWFVNVMLNYKWMSLMNRSKRQVASVQNCMLNPSEWQSPKIINWQLFNCSPVRSVKRIFRRQRSICFARRQQRRSSRFRSTLWKEILYLFRVRQEFLFSKQPQITSAYSHWRKALRLCSLWQGFRPQTKFVWPPTSPLRRKAICL